MVAARILWLTCFLWLSLAPSWALAQAVVDEIRTLVRDGRSAEAYALGKQNPDELGNPQFDLAFGIAAINSGHAAEGVLALERYVLQAADDLNARLELARGYFVLGDDLRAKEEFGHVLASQPSAEVRTNIERFLDAIRSRESQYRPTAALYVEAGYGYDDNINGGVGSNNLVLPNGAAVVVGNAFVKTRDRFLHLATGANGTLPLAPGVALFGAASLSAKQHDTKSPLDQESLGFTGGASFLREKDLFRVGLGLDSLSVENSRYRDVWSLSGEWHRQLDELQGVSGFVQLSDIQYTAANQVRDASFNTLGAGYRRAFIHPWRPLLSASAYGGREDVRSAARGDLSRDVLGTRLAVSFTPVPRWSLGVGLSYQESRYAGGDPLPVGFTPLPPRRDSYEAADAVLGYAISRELSIRGEIVTSRNRSNNALYQYDRNVAAIKLRYDFK